MGRARAILKCIQNKRARKVCFAQRKKGLMKKVSEFCIMTGAQACLIMYEADGNGDPVTCPEDDPAKVHSLLEKYEERKKNKNGKPAPKIFDLEDFFEGRKRKVEAEIIKVEKEIENIKAPTSDPSTLDFLIAKLDAKIEECDARINMFKFNKTSQSEEELSLVQNIISQDQDQLNLDSTNQPAGDEAVDLIN